MITENGLENMVWFLGVVEDNRDPLNGRVRVRAFGFHPPYSEGTVPTDALPWAHVVRDSKFATIPDMGDMVIGFFMDGRDAQVPCVLGTLNSAKLSAPVGGSAGVPYSSEPYQGPAATGGSTANARIVYDYLVSKGFTPEAAAGVVGNLQIESTVNIDPGISEYGGGGGYGIAQWTIQSRKDALQQFALDQGRPMDDLYLQMDFIVHEFRSDPYYRFDELQQASTPEEAAQIVHDTYENPDRSVSQIGQRRAYARSIYDTSATAPSNTPMVENEQMAPSTKYVAGFGNPAMPPQISRENLEQTQYTVQAASRTSATVPGSSSSSSSSSSSANTTPVSYAMEQPEVPMPGGINSSVWYASHDGAFIEMAGRPGQSPVEQHINVSHPSGSHMVLDGNGNVVLKAMGTAHSSSEGDSHEMVQGAKLSVYTSGWAVHIAGGACEIQAIGDMNLTAGGDLNIGAGGRVSISAGDGVDISGARVGITARVDAVDILAPGKVAIQSQGALSLTGKDTYVGGATVNVSSDGTLRLTGSDSHLGGSSVRVGGGSLNLSGSITAPTISLGSPPSPDSASKGPAAVAAPAVEPPARGVSAPTTPRGTRSTVGISMMDDYA